MILTEDIMERGKSSNGGWSVKQINVFGIPNFKHKWRRDLLGKEVSEEQIRQFLALKDCHINGEKKKKIRDLSFEPISKDLKYADQYKHPNWQKFRLFVLNRDQFKCVNCHSGSKTLHAHHLKYLKGKFIWEVPYWYVVTLCEDCHSEEHGRDLRLK